jgi:hypothetical protein
VDGGVGEEEDREVEGQTQPVAPRPEGVRTGAAVEANRVAGAAAAALSALVVAVGKRKWKCLVEHAQIMIYFS